MYDDNNIFAKIIRGEVEAKKIYEDNKVLAFNDISPVAPVHILIVPKGRYIDYDDFINNSSEEDISYFFQKVLEIAKKYGAINNEFRLVTNKGSTSGQSIFHFHIHIIAGKKMSGLVG